MKRKIHTTLLSFACAVLVLTSCSDWLTLYPQDEIKEEYLFSTGDGFRTATNGIYRKMATFNMYGSNLTWGLIDAWGQVYNIDAAPVSGGGKAMEKITALEFKHVDLVPTTNALWTAAWNVVANCNELAQQVVKADPAIFTYLDVERKMILGEAIGLRAFVQFDLLRIYAPSPAMNPGNKTFIPYVDVYPSYVNDHQTVDYCLEHIIKDLKESQAILYEIDKDSRLNVTNRFEVSNASKEGFLGSRGYRLNYYAVTAELARVYLYAGKMKEAYAEAKKIIDAEKKNKFFQASGSEYDFEDGNMKMFDDVIFALYSPTELVEFDQQINHNNDGKEYEYYLCFDSKVLKNLYGEDYEHDFRRVYQMEKRGYYDFSPLKYYKQVSSQYFTFTTNNSLLPMIRMSEVYYIAAEAIYNNNPEEALNYLKIVKDGRGANTQLEATDRATFMDLLENDARREFAGEGQIFYMYKRLLRPMITGDPNGENILPLEANMVLPLPDSETNI